MGTWLAIGWLGCGSVRAQLADTTQVRLVFPAREDWTQLREGERLAFRLQARGGTSSAFRFAVPSGKLEGMQLDSLGNFSWIPPFDFVKRLEEARNTPVIFEAINDMGETARQQVDFNVMPVNQPPTVGELRPFYAQNNALNTYQLDLDAVRDPDGDPIVFLPVLETTPEGAKLSPKGEFTWKPSSGQFNDLVVKPLWVEFLVEDQPGKARTKGKLLVRATQMDLAPDIMVTSSADEDAAAGAVVHLREGHTLDLNFVLSDPNGDNTIKSFNFVADEPRVVAADAKAKNRPVLRGASPTLYEFVWTPGYDFVPDTKDSLVVNFTFFALDKTNKRAEKRVTLAVMAAEDAEAQDRNLYGKYRATLATTWEMLEQLFDKERELKSDLRQARRGKRNRSLANASLGAITGVSPAVFQSDPNARNLVAGFGGTAVATMGSLEAANVLGKSQNELLDKLNAVIEKKNELQTKGDTFARAYALSPARREKNFTVSQQELVAAMSLKVTLLLELEAGPRNSKTANDAQINRTFRDFTPLAE